MELRQKINIACIVITATAMGLVAALAWLYYLGQPLNAWQAYGFTLGLLAVDVAIGVLCAISLDRVSKHE